MHQQNYISYVNKCQGVVDKNFCNIFKNIIPTGYKNNVVPERKNRGFLFIVNKKMVHNSIWQRKILRKKLNFEYVTLSAFWRESGGRTKENLRWICALALDFDSVNSKEKLCKYKLSLKIADKGLPPASMIVRTPSGGLHIWWFVKPIRATKKAVILFEALQQSLAIDLGADQLAVGAERLWRLPTSNNVLYSNKKTYKLSVFKKWRNENRPADMPAPRSENKQFFFRKGLVNNSGIQKMLKGVKAGIRNNSCFSCAVAFLMSGYDRFETEKLLLDWNKKNSPPLPEQEVLKCISSACKGLIKDTRHYYNAMRYKVKMITGEQIKYTTITPPKKREDRKRSHIREWIEDIKKLVKKRGGVLALKQTQLAQLLNAPMRSIRAAIKELKNSGELFIFVKKQGPKSITIIISNEKHLNKNRHTRIHSMEYSSAMNLSEFLLYTSSNTQGRFRRSNIKWPGKGALL